MSMYITHSLECTELNILFQHATAAQYLLPYLKPGSKVLDVGSGSGYLCAVFYHLISSNSSNNISGVEDKGIVVGVDHIPELVGWSKSNLQKDGLSDALDGNEKARSASIQILTADGRLGWPPSSPYDAIHVGAAAVSEDDGNGGPHSPQALVKQLKAPGRMFVPVEGRSGDQKIYVVDKDENGIVSEKAVLNVMVRE